MEVERYEEVDRMQDFLRKNYSADNLKELEDVVGPLKEEVDFYKKELEVPFEQRTAAMFQRYGQTALDYHCILQRISEIKYGGFGDWFFHRIDADNHEAMIANLKKRGLC